MKITKEELINRAYNLAFKVSVENNPDKLKLSSRKLFDQIKDDIFEAKSKKHIFNLVIEMANHILWDDDYDINQKINRLLKGHTNPYFIENRKITGIRYTSNHSDYISSENISSKYKWEIRDARAHIKTYGWDSFADVCETEFPNWRDYRYSHLNTEDMYPSTCANLIPIL